MQDLPFPRITFPWQVAPAPGTDVCPYPWCDAFSPCVGFGETPGIARHSRARVPEGTQQSSVCVLQGAGLGHGLRGVVLVGEGGDGDEDEDDEGEDEDEKDEGKGEGEGEDEDEGEELRLQHSRQRCGSTAVCNEQGVLHESLLSHTPSILQPLGPSCEVSPGFLIAGGNPNPSQQRLTPWVCSGDGHPTIRPRSVRKQPLAPHKSQSCRERGSPAPPQVLRASRCPGNYQKPAKSRQRHEVTVYQLIREPLIQPIMSALLMATALWKLEFAAKAGVLPR